MSGDAQVRFCVGLGGRFPGPTRLSGNPQGAQAGATLYSLIFDGQGQRPGALQLSALPVRETSSRECRR